MIFLKIREYMYTYCTCTKNTAELAHKILLIFNSELARTILSITENLNSLWPESSMSRVTQSDKMRFFFEHLKRRKAKCRMSHDVALLFLVLYCIYMDYGPCRRYNTCMFINISKFHMRRYIYVLLGSAVDMLFCLMLLSLYTITYHPNQKQPHDFVHDFSLMPTFRLRLNYFLKIFFSRHILFQKNKRNRKQRRKKNGGSTIK